MRRNSVALTRTQWFLVAIATTVAVGGLVVALTLHTSIGFIVTSLATLTAFLVLGFGRTPDDPPGPDHHE
jgi:hypothetical protein